MQLRQLYPYSRLLYKYEWVPFFKVHTQILKSHRNIYSFTRIDMRKQYSQGTPKSLYDMVSS